MYFLERAVNNTNGLILNAFHLFIQSGLWIPLLVKLKTHVQGQRIS